MKLTPSGKAANIFDERTWFKNAKPMGGETHWRDGRSAKELAQYITDALPSVPQEIEELLANFIPGDSDLFWDAEYVTEFSKFDLGKGEGRNHDAAMWNDQIFIGIEGKADETFGDIIGKEYKDCSDNKKKRIDGLCNMIWGKAPNDYSEIRYQLLTASAGILLEAKERGLEKALFLVIVFKRIIDGEKRYKDEKITENKKDVKAFLRKCDAADLGYCYKVPTVFGAANGIELYFKEIEIKLS